MAQLFPPLNLPEGVILLITDDLSAPADFALHRALATHLKLPRHREEPTPRALILSVSEDYGRWKALARASKSNINLQNHVDSGSVIFMDMLAGFNLPVHVHSEDKSSLRAAFDRIQGILSSKLEKLGSTLIIVDDVSTLDWIGIPSADVQKFIRALRALCLKNKETLVIRHHLVSPSREHDDLFRLLLQICTHHLEVRPLSSGRSGTVTGEMSLHQGFSDLSETAKPVNRNSALQYRLTDTGPEFFAKGMSAGVL